MRKPTILSVSQLNFYIKSYLEENSKLQEIYIKGEISNFSRHFNTGHIYFTLKDEKSAVRAVMFRSNAEYLKFEPDNGMSVIVRGFVTLYERDGTYQLNLSEIQPDGLGSLQLAYEQLKEKLFSEGLFDNQYKQPIPRYPTSIAVITSQNGAALQDVLSIINRRYPLVRITLLPVSVQGANAVPEIVQALEKINEIPEEFDTVILCRGGGSLEDLWPFNEELVVRAIFACSVPLISAIGHETDITLSDFAADLRAPTPSAAAELSVPDIAELNRRISSYKYAFAEYAHSLIKTLQSEMDAIKANEFIKSPLNIVDSNRQKLSDLVNLIQCGFASILSNKLTELKRITNTLDNLSPLKILGRGYTYTEDGNGVISAVDSVVVGQEIMTTFSNGRIKSKVVEIDEKKVKL